MRFASIQCSKVRLRLGLCPGPRWRSLQRSLDYLAGFKGVAAGGRREGGGREREERGKEGAEGRLTLMHCAQLEQVRRLAIYIALVSK